jgi:ElaA protein
MFSDIIKKSFDELTLEELYQILDLRNIVFIMEQKINYIDTDFKDQACVHYMIKDQGKIIAYLRVVPKGKKFKEYALSRVVSHPQYRGLKLGEKLVKVAMKDYIGEPFRISGQAYLKEFYERLGFEVVKGPYIEEDILHYEMLSKNEE